jgi:hypothetical protein
MKNRLKLGRIQFCSESIPKCLFHVDRFLQVRTVAGTLSAVWQITSGESRMPSEAFWGLQDGASFRAAGIVLRCEFFHRSTDLSTRSAPP